MTHKLKNYLLLASIAYSVTNIIQTDDSCCSGLAQSQNTLQPHAFSVSMSREILLEKPAWEGMDDVEGWHGAFSVGFEYMKNWGNPNSDSSSSCCSALGAMPFWAANQSNTMTLGSNGGTYDFDVYQLGLGRQEAYTEASTAATVYTAQSGTVTLNPSIYQTGADLFLYAGAHKTEKGFFVKLHGPIGVISVNPCLSSTGTIAGRAYERGILNAANANVSAPYETIEQAFAGGKETGYLKKMNYGKIDSKRTSSAKFGDLAGAVGYNVFADESKHLGIALRFSAPTGNTYDPEYVFDPIFGRNGHWAIGGELIGHWRAWESDSNDRYLDIWFDGSAEHLFTSKHSRSFDLKANGLGSKYLLVAKYTGTPGVFQNEIQNAINITTIPVESTFTIEGDFALMFDMHWNSWNVGLGYEGWGRSCEKLKVNCNSGCTTSTDFNNYAILGRQAPYSSADGTTATNLCQPTAKIGKSDARVDAATSTAVDATSASNRISSDLATAIDIDAQRAHDTYTSKLFAQIAYTWKDSDYAPYMGLMGGAEFNHSYNNAIKFWSVGVHGGIAF